MYPGEYELEPLLPQYQPDGFDCSPPPPTLYNEPAKSLVDVNVEAQRPIKTRITEAATAAAREVMYVEEARKTEKWGKWDAFDKAMFVMYIFVFVILMYLVVVAFFALFGFIFVGLLYLLTMALDLAGKQVAEFFGLS